MKFINILTLSIVSLGIAAIIISNNKVNVSKAQLKQAHEINAELLKANKSLAELATTFRGDLVTVANEYTKLYTQYTNLQSISAVKIENFKQ